MLHMNLFNHTKLQLLLYLHFKCEKIHLQKDNLVYLSSLKQFNLHSSKISLIFLFILVSIMSLTHLSDFEKKYISSHCTMPFTGTITVARIQE